MFQRVYGIRGGQKHCPFLWMFREREYYVYIMASRSHVLYCGVTNNIWRRVHEHREGKKPGFTQRYYVRQLVYVESTNDIGAAIAREKQIKGWKRAKKVALIERVNPEWKDISCEG